jgi:hypothetical protein
MSEACDEIHTGLSPSFKERILDDDYPVYGDYLYVITRGDVSKVIRSDVHGTVKDLKRDMNADAVRNCDVKSRNLFAYLA